MINTTSIEVKYKNLKKPMYLKALENFNNSQNITYSFVVNKNYNHNDGKNQYITPYLIEKIFSKL